MERMNRIAAMFAALTVLFAAAAQTSAELRYFVTDLGVLPGGDRSGAHYIDDNDVVIGWSSDAADGWPWGCRWDGGVPTQLTQVSGALYSYVRQINAAGQIVGWSKLAPSDCATMWAADGTPTTFTVPGVVHSYAEAINDAGKIVGVSTRDWGGIGSGAWTWDSTNGIQTLPTLGGSEAGAWNIDHADNIIGWAALPSGDPRACLWRSGNAIDLGTLGAESWAAGINGSGVIVGASKFDNGAKHACRFDGVGGVHDLGTLGGHNGLAMFVGEDGRVVGWDNTDNGETHALLYEEGIMKDLNDLIPEDSAWLLERAYALNAHDHVVGFGIINDEQHAFLLTPIPEPTTLLLFGSVGTLLVTITRRRNRKRWEAHKAGLHRDKRSW